MKKLTKILPLIASLVLTLGLFGCDTEVAEFDSVKDAVETAEKESKEEVKTKTVEERNENPDIINVENNDLLKTLLANGGTNDEYIKFFTDNQYNIIEFSGAIDAIDLIPEKKTRYSLLLRSGEYDANSITGPSFIVKDVGGNDKSIRDLFLAGKGEVGQPVNIVAKILGYDKNSDCIKLHLISISDR